MWYLRPEEEMKRFKVTFVTLCEDPEPWNIYFRNSPSEESIRWLAYIKPWGGLNHKANKEKKKMMQDGEKTLKIAKKADLWAKRELRFTAGSQGHAKKDQQAQNYPECCTQRIKLKQI